MPIIRLRGGKPGMSTAKRDMMSGWIAGMTEKIIVKIVLTIARTIEGIARPSARDSGLNDAKT